ncbi:MAG: VCBS repeat-containing protein [Verrucomicrobia bacterium]|nr:VCBS repeat-containing protein [Verrucomicrobiota bacterium]
MPDPLRPVPAPISARIKQAALASLVDDEASKVRLSISTEIFPQGHVFKLVETTLTVSQEAALVFVDRKPSANWGHPCTYRFFSPINGEFLYQEDALFPPNLAGGTPLETFHSPGAVSPIAILPELLVPIRPSPVESVAAEQRYAILWTSQISDLRHVEDLEFMWRTLVNVYGFTAANIYSLCYNGTIGAVNAPNPVGNWAGNNTPYQMKVYASATVANLQAVINTLAGKLKPRDLLLVHTNNHGSPSGLCVDDSSVITPDQFADMIAGLPQFRTLIVTMEQCYSGAFQVPVLKKSTAMNTVFASAVPANLESAGAAHFDPWALDLIDALNGATPSGGSLSAKPTTNFDGQISIKAACDWAKGADTGTGDDPQYGDNPAGCGSSIFLGPQPPYPNRTGDVNADGCVEIVVTSPWGLGILEQVGNTFEGLVVAPNGTRFGGWLLNTADNVVGPLADVDGDGKAEILMSSPWGIGLLKLSGQTLNSLVMAPNGTKLGDWTLDTTNNLFVPLADVDGDGKAEIIVTSPWGIGILKLAGNTLTSLTLAPNGTRLGQWLFESENNTIGPACDYDGDGKAEILITSPWGVGILKLSGNALTSLMLQPNGTDLGQWRLDTSNNNLGRSADYDGDGAAEILATSPWGIGILKLTGNTLTSLMLAPNGTRFGGWLFNSPDDIIGPAANYIDAKKAGLMVSSAWGIGILALSGNTLTAPAMQPNGTRFGGWLLNTSDNLFGEAASYDGQSDVGLLVTSPWGIGTLKVSGNTFSAPLMQPNGTRFSGWLLNTADNQF